MTERRWSAEEERYRAPAWLDRVQRRALLLGVFAALLSVVGALLSPEHFFRAYLVGFLFWIGIPLGLFGISMLQHMTGGGWGLVARRVFEAASRTLPFLALLFLPLLWGRRSLYVWARPEVVAESELLQHKQPYLNEPFFLGRALLYFGVWLLFALLLSRWSLQQDRSNDPHLHRRMQILSSLGLVAYMLTASFASFDWLMSLDPAWFSSLFGIHFVVGHGAAAFAFLIVWMRRLSGTEPMADVVAPRHFDDYGKFLLAFVLLWAYVSFSQFLIIWSGNLPEEITWYVHRQEGGWWWLGIVVFALHFVLPFFLLLSPALRREPARLALVALPVLVGRWLDLHWQAVPSLELHAPLLHWLDIAVLVAIGGLWLAAFLWQLKRRALVPIHDPHLQEALADA
ncbi:MAG: hypothetical protein JSW67_01615 [Candidatus Latescibacterota bacterium]|nr:MAG: hypothetical protein JSW67_01615 [Candidatus Latescibacterota bacterium]